MQILSSYPSSAPANDNKINDVEVSAAELENQDKKSADTKAADKAEPEQKFNSRAEKFAQLNKEFDITGGRFKITDQFINRLQEMELLTDSEASKLSSGLSSDTKSTDSVAALDSKITALTERVEGKSEFESLIVVLNKAKQVLGNLDGSKSKVFPIDPSTAAAELEQFLKSDESSLLTDDEKESVKDLQIALTIADRLNPEQRTSAEVGKYMEILNRFRTS